MEIVDYVINLANRIVQFNFSDDYASISVDYNNSFKYQVNINVI